MFETTERKNEYYKELICELTPDDILPGVMDKLKKLIDNPNNCPMMEMIKKKYNARLKIAIIYKRIDRITILHVLSVYSVFQLLLKPKNISVFKLFSAENVSIIF